jgi:hypothetical protein
MKKTKLNQTKGKLDENCRILQVCNIVELENYQIQNTNTKWSPRMREGLVIRDKYVFCKHETLWICEYNAATIIHRTDIWKKHSSVLLKKIMEQASGTSIYEEQQKPKT